MKKEKRAFRYPYARVKGLEEFMTFAQEPNWRPAAVNIELLKRLGMAKGKEREAVNALKFLGVIDDECLPSGEFDNLKKNYQDTLKKLVILKYEELFNLIPTKLINQSRLVNFFGGPVDTAEYQAELFVWLCKQSGIELPSMESTIHRARYDKK